MTEMFHVSAKGMLLLDSQMLKMHWRIIQMKIRQANTMGKPNNKLCKQALKQDMRIVS